MTVPFQELTTYDKNDWQEFLERRLLIDIFMPILKAYTDPQDVRVIIRYIAYTYSLQSEHIVLGLDWKKNKEQIFEYVMAKPHTDYYDDLVMLKSPAVIQTVHSWLEFQNSITFTHLQILRDLKVEMQQTSLLPIKKSSGEVDYDQKFRNAEYAGKLQERIKELEAELVQNNNKMKEAVKEVRTTKNHFNVGPETYAK